MNVEMKKKMGVPASRPVAYFLPTISIKATDFAAEITNVNVYNTTQIEETFLCHINIHTLRNSYLHIHLWFLGGRGRE